MNRLWIVCRDYSFQKQIQRMLLNCPWIIKLVLFCWRLVSFTLNQCCIRFLLLKVYVTDVLCSYATSNNLFTFNNSLQIWYTQTSNITKLFTILIVLSLCRARVIPRSCLGILRFSTTSSSSSSSSRDRIGRQPRLRGFSRCCHPRHQMSTWRGSPFHDYAGRSHLHTRKRYQSLATIIWLYCEGTI